MDEGALTVVGFFDLCELEVPAVAGLLVVAGLAGKLLALFAGALAGADGAVGALLLFEVFVSTSVLFLAFLAAALAAFLAALASFFFFFFASLANLSSAFCDAFFEAFFVFFASFSSSLLTFFASFSAVLLTDFFSCFDPVVRVLSLASKVDAISVVSFLVVDFIKMVLKIKIDPIRGLKLKKSTNTYVFFRKNKNITLFLC